MKYAPLLTTCIAFAAVAATSLALASEGGSLHSVNGSVSASDGQTYDSLSTVNGSVHVGKGASANVAKTVNGKVELEDDAKVGTASTVNGSVVLGAGAAVAQEATTVNGSVKVGKRAKVGGNVESVSGSIKVDGGEIGGHIQTRNGDIDLTDGARVRNGIIVLKKNDNGWRSSDGKPVHVNICATCVVDGELRFEQPVELHVESGGKIGTVVGDNVKRL
jgi:hypothetical protein